jgi:hypothetical protein
VEEAYDKDGKPVARATWREGVQASTQHRYQQFINPFFAPGEELVRGNAMSASKPPSLPSCPAS